MKEASTGKITSSYIIRFILWFILFQIIALIIAFAASASAAESISSTSSVSEMSDFLKGFVQTLAIADIVAIIISVLLATRGIKKKFSITNENRKKILINITIFLIIMTVLSVLSHNAIVSLVYDEATKDSDINIEELKEDVDTYVEEHDLTSEEEEIVEMFSDILGLGTLYTFDGLAFLVMIPVEFLLIKKKENE